MSSRSKVSSGRLFGSSLQPCAPNPSSYRRMPKGNTSIIKGCAMSNPEILSSVSSVDQGNRDPYCPNSSNDCSMTQQKKNLGHPVHQNRHTKTSKRGSLLPVHYTIPPLDYRTYLQRQKEQMCSTHGNDFEQKCYLAKKDLKKIRCFEEFYNRNRKNKPSGICPKCKANKSLKNLPHCCACRCAHFQKLGWQNVNPSNKQGEQSSNTLEERSSSHLKCLPIKRSSIGQPRLFSDVKYEARKCEDEFEKHRDCDDVENRLNCSDVDEPECPCGPVKTNSYRKGPSTEYQASYQYHLWDHSCSISKPKTDYNNNNNGSSEKSNSKPRPWNYSIKSETSKYEETLAAAEAKLEILDNLLNDKRKEVPDYLHEQQHRKDSNLRRLNPRALIRRTLIEEGWGNDEDEENLKDEENPKDEENSKDEENPKEE